MSKFDKLKAGFNLSSQGLKEAAHTQIGLPLSDIVQVPVDKLKENANNTTYFKQESEQYFSRLLEDVKERGIIVPLIAKKDGTLLAGHNRLRVARQLGFPTVPVQYVYKELTHTEETGLIIKDNVLRRQLSAEDMMVLYRKLYPTFDEDILYAESDRRGKRSSADTSILTAKKIANDTNQSYETVKKQITRERKKIHGDKSKRDKSLLESSQKEESTNVNLKRDKSLLQDQESTLASEQFETSPQFSEFTSEVLKVEAAFLRLSTQEKTQAIHKLRTTIDSLEKQK